LTKSIAFATSKDFPNLLSDDRLIVDKLKDYGISVNPVIWNDKSINWEQFDVVVVRSPWDYYYHPEDYKSWLSSFLHSKTKLLNPPQTILDNVDKRYLLDLEQQGIAIIPTALVTEGSQQSLELLIQQNNWDKIVIKPVISAGAYGTWRSSKKTAINDQTKFAEQITKETVFVQPFMPEIQSEGEWSVIYINGEYSHSVLKSVKGKDFRIQEEFGGTTKFVEPTRDILKQTQKIMDLQQEALLYARVDGVIRDGQFLLMELEVNEPSLFFEFSQSAVEMFAQAVYENF